MKKQMTSFLIVLLFLVSLGAVPASHGDYTTAGSITREPALWVKSYGGSGYDGASAVAIAPNGDIIVAGSTDSFGAGTSGYYPHSNAWVLRLNGDDGSVN